MKAIVERNVDGGLYIPAELLELVQPHTRFVIEVQDGKLTLHPENAVELENKQPFWATATPQEQAESLLQWVDSIKDGVGLPDEALRRENMYD
ncbi:hypothetical protein [Iningainema tapete]|uniref:Uncharacterized protein n=1 Tax=Iningainema tapete BLCC-T55 TaxID=2748662 RepID=A0A8J6XGS8_9CYAN|nr:hypothetical protein [Iningainema tapete]MBD2771776.1 hypothetical protein [Iningainema tapete BLCC-T55]